MLNDIQVRVTRARVIAMALLFVLVQYASILHATEHPFHGDDASCEIFHAVEKSKSIVADAKGSVLSARFDDLYVMRTVGRIASAAVRPYRSRAPPATSLI